MEALLKQASLISTKHEEINKSSGRNFNIFKIIDLTTEEVRLHSSFIAELLNPKGSHGQGDCFLKRFIELNEIENFATENVKVYTEYHIGKVEKETGGRIDILIDDRHGNVITIENKIYAKDQENQLLRYHNYAPNGHLFYLTLMGDMPSENSYNDLILKEDFNLLSYKDDIIDWLNECKKEAVDLPIIREGITHYIQLIKSLTGQHNNNTMSKEITDLITSSPQNLRTALQLNESIENAKSRIQWNFWKAIIKAYEEKGYKSIDGKSVNWQDVHDYYSKSRNNKYYGLHFELDTKENVTFYFGIQIENNIYYGFFVKCNNENGISDRIEYEGYRNIVKDIDCSYLNNKWWLGWKYPQPKLDFRTFFTDEILKLADPNELEATVNQIVNQSISDIMSFKEQINQI